MEDQEKLEFQKETKYQVGGITFDVISHFDEESEDLLTKLKRLLKNEAQNLLTCGL